MKFKILKTIAVTALISSVSVTAGIADILDTIKERGTLIVGVKADYKPYGFLDSSGTVIGLEPDLAQDVADKLGVAIEYVPVVSSNRMQFLEQGKIDLMIATMTDKPDRRKVVQIVDPNYYSSGTNVLALKSLGLKDWNDLNGKPVCGIQGAFYNKATSQNYGAEISRLKEQQKPILL